VLIEQVCVTEADTGMLVLAVAACATPRAFRSKHKSVVPMKYFFIFAPV
jgi:hypothetical protein